jgi:hypothetical protein
MFHCVVREREAVQQSEPTLERRERRDRWHCSCLRRRSSRSSSSSLCFTLNEAVAGNFASASVAAMVPAAAAGCERLFLSWVRARAARSCRA